MTIGGGIGLIAVGAILMYAIGDTQVGPVNFYVIGVILVLAGLAGLVLGFAQNSRRGSVKTTEVHHNPDGTQTVTERRTDSH